jgi:hypothetical protein
LAIALMAMAMLATPNQSLANGGGDNPACSTCYNGCKAITVPDCPGTNAGCNALDGCGPGRSNCNCKDGGQSNGSYCVCV